MAWNLEQGKKDAYPNSREETDLDSIKTKGVICTIFQRGLNILRESHNRNSVDQNGWVC